MPECFNDGYGKNIFHIFPKLSVFLFDKFFECNICHLSLIM